MLRLATAVHDATEVVLLLDYDGTLIPSLTVPDLAAPDDDLIELLTALSHRPQTRVHVVSGRTREVLETWLGALPVVLHAEHGFWSRSGPGQPWVARAALPDEWKRGIRQVLDEFTTRTPGTFVEEKSASIVWHYRLADPEFGVMQARELRVHLANAFSNAPVETLERDKAVEVRAQGVPRGLAVSSLPMTSATCVLAMGNDATDEEMFEALPATALTIHVGRGATRARFRLANTIQARAVLRSLLPAGVKAVA